MTDFKIQPLHERRVYSQFGEDGIIAAILSVIGTTTKTFIEIGVGDGTECNCRLLRQNGFDGVMIDAEHSNANVIRSRVTARNVQLVLHNFDAPNHPDVLSIDIDGIDWYVIKNLGPYLPRLLVCEFNANWGPDECTSVPYDETLGEFINTKFFGASSLAMHRLANELGMHLVYSNKYNMFFVEANEKDKFCNADDPEIRYQGYLGYFDDPRMSRCVDPFTVSVPPPITSST